MADVSMLQAYNEVFEKYNIEDGNFRVKKELIRQYMALPIIVTLIGAIVGNILGYTVMKNVCASMYYGSYSLYTNGEIGKLYIWSTTIVVIICLLLSLPIEKAGCGVPGDDAVQRFRLDCSVDRPEDLPENVPHRNRHICGCIPSGIPQNPPDSNG